MDNLTHSLTGFLMSRAGLNRVGPGVTAVLLVAANAPDIDVVSLFAGPAAALTWHRNFTHSFLCAPLLAVLSVALVRYVFRQRLPWGSGFAIALAGVLSHLLLDLTNNYGIRLWLPFSPNWSRLDTTFVFDVWIFAALLLGVVAPFLSGLVSSEIGQENRPRYPGVAWPLFSLFCMLAIESGHFILHARAVATLEARIYGGEVPRRVAAFPSPLHPLEWSGLVETSNRYFLYDLDLTTEFDPVSGRPFYKSDPGNAVALLTKQHDFNALIGFTQFPLWRVADDGESRTLKLTDLRFGDPLRDTFTCEARITNRNAVASEKCDLRFSPNWK